MPRGAKKPNSHTQKKMNLDHRQNRFADNIFSLTKMSTSVQFSVQDSAEDVYCTVFSTGQRGSHNISNKIHTEIFLKNTFFL